MMARTAFGQEMDIQTPSEETAYWRVVENKSALFYGFAFHSGALFGDAKPLLILYALTVDPPAKR